MWVVSVHWLSVCGRECPRLKVGEDNGRRYRDGKRWMEGDAEREREIYRGRVLFFFFRDNLVNLYQFFFTLF